MKPVLLSTQTIEKGSYNIIIEYYDNDDLVVSVLDFETKETLDRDWETNSTGFIY